jgi:hypothetical protein
MEPEFSVAEGIAIQTKHLKAWKKVLTRKTYSALVEFATKGNDSAFSGWQIKKGSDLSIFIYDYAKTL